MLLTTCGGGPPPPSGPPTVPVTVASVEVRPMPVDIEAIGTVEAPSTVAVRPRVGGELIGIHFSPGQDVRQGQLLFTLDPGPFQADVAEARARLARDQALAAKAAEDVQRYRDLAAKDYVTQEQYLQVKASSESLAATVAADEAALRSAELQLGYATIHSPMDGRTGELLMHRGNMVKANDQTLVVIHQVEPVDVRFAVPQDRLPEIRRRAAEGTLEVEVSPPRSKTEPQKGELTFVDNAIDPATGTIGLKATFPNQGRDLWPGQFVEVQLHLATEPAAIVAPAPAVQTGQQGDYVFVVGDDLIVESRPVDVDRNVDGQVVIARGLNGGETVVTDGQLRLVPGSRVEIKNRPTTTTGEASP